MKELEKRIILTRFWIGDVVYHIADSSRGTITRVQINTDRYVPQYYTIFEKREGEWCDEMELSAQKIFATDSPGETTKA